MLPSNDGSAVNDLAAGSGDVIPQHNGATARTGVMAEELTALRRELEIALANSAGWAAEVATVNTEIASLLHAVRSPLSTISIWVEMLKDDNLGEAERRQGLLIIAESVRETASLMADWTNRRPN